VDAPLLSQLQSIIMAPAGAAASSSPKFQGINVSAGETERAELENVSYNVVLHAFFYVGK
jgi:hypothetical protein